MGSPTRIKNLANARNIIYISTAVSGNITGFGSRLLRSLGDSLTLMEAKVRFGGDLTVMGSEMSVFSSLDNIISM